MKTNTFARAFLLPVAALAVVGVLGACGGGSEPEAREFGLRIEGRKLNLDPAVIKVNQGDTVTLNIDADEHGTFHLHGYDIEIDLSLDETAKMEFVASATGKFNITFHPGEEEQGKTGEQKHEEDKKDSGDTHDEEAEEIPIASLEVRPR